MKVTKQGAASVEFVEGVASKLFANRLTGKGCLEAGGS